MEKPMNKSNLFNGTVLIATLCTGMLVQAQESIPALTQPPSQPDPALKLPGSAATGDQTMKVNKASGLIGMEIKNQAGESLGKIRDVVIDLKTERAAYCVLAVSGGMFSKEKLLAVPLRAFQVDAEGTTLTLNTDKDKLARAEGFDRNNWPSPENPVWAAEPFWKSAPSPTRSDGDMIKQPPATPDQPETPDDPEKHQDPAKEPG
jgi:sporulation protein YlmC with PRC-barrel domain